MMPTLLVTGTCTGYKRKLRLAPSHSAAQGRGPRGALKGPFGTLPPPLPGPPGTQMPREEKIPPVITPIGTIIWNRFGSFSICFGFSGRRDLLVWLGDGLFGLATAGGGRYVESLEPQVSTHTHHPRLLSYAVGGRVGCMSLLTSILAITALRINVQYIRLGASVHTSGQGSKESVHRCQL